MCPGHQRLEFDVYMKPAEQGAEIQMQDVVPEVENIGS